MKIAGSLLVAALFLLIFSSCKGRTMENMEPAGDTVEVNIDTVHYQSAEDSTMTDGNY